MQVSPAHHVQHTLPVQAAPPVKPVRARPPEPAEGPKPLKAATPAHVGKKLDIHA